MPHPFHSIHGQVEGKLPESGREEQSPRSEMSHLYGGLRKEASWGGDRSEPPPLTSPPQGNSFFELGDTGILASRPGRSEVVVQKLSANPPQGNSIFELGDPGSLSFGPHGPKEIVLRKSEQSTIMATDPLQGNSIFELRGDEALTPAASSTTPDLPLTDMCGGGGLRSVRSGGGESQKRPLSKSLSFWETTLAHASASQVWDPPPNDSHDETSGGHTRPFETNEEQPLEPNPTGGGAANWCLRQENMDLATREEDTLTRPGLPKDKKSNWIDDVPVGFGSDPALQRARRRNVVRLKKANEADMHIMSKYLPSDVKAFFPFEVEGPDDEYEVEEIWLKKVLSVAKSKSQVPRPPSVRFGTSPVDLDHNINYLESCDWDFEKVFADHRGTTVDHGSEFRPIDELRTILGQHPHFATLSKMFTEGFDYHLTRELSEEERVAELSAQLTRGNHRSATDSEREVQLLLEGDVRHGFVFPVWESALLRVKGCMLQPGGMVRQLSLKADGSRKIKNRFTHDLSFSISSEDASINSRIDMDQYPDMVYGWCLQRILHYLAALRSRYPGIKIYLSKFDYSDAYRRISQSPKATAASVVKFGNIAYFCWRMVFGGSPNPAGFSCFSEMLTDLANELAMSSYHPKMGSSDTVEPSHLIPKNPEEPGKPVGEAIRPALLVSTSLTSYRDCFIDDIIDCHLGTPENLARAPHIVQLSVQAMSRPHAGDEKEPVPRRPLLGPEKLEAEG